MLERIHLQSLRRKLNIKLSQIAKDLFIPINDLSKYESGYTPIPHEIFERWLKYLQEKW